MQDITFIVMVHIILIGEPFLGGGRLFRISMAIYICIYSQSFLYSSILYLCLMRLKVVHPTRRMISTAIGRPRGIILLTEKISQPKPLNPVRYRGISRPQVWTLSPIMKKYSYANIFINNIFPTNFLHNSGDNNILKLYQATENAAAGQNAPGHTHNPLGLSQLAAIFDLLVIVYSLH